MHGNAISYTLKPLALLVGVLLLTACAADPKIVKVKKGDEHTLNCEQLQVYAKEANWYGQQARKEDGFQWKYLSPFNAMVSAYRIIVADTSAKERERYLKDLYEIKGCYNTRPYVKPLPVSAATTYAGNKSIYWRQDEQ